MGLTLLHLFYWLKYLSLNRMLMLVSGSSFPILATRHLGQITHRTDAFHPLGVMGQVGEFSSSLLAPAAD